MAVLPDELEETPALRRRRERMQADPATRTLEPLDPATLDVLDPRELTGIDGWSLVSNRGWIPEKALVPAFRKTVRDEPDPCYRTRMMIHDGLDALAGRWGRDRVDAALGTDAAAGRLRDFWSGEYDKEGFWSIKLRLVDPVTPEMILDMLRTVGRRIRRPASINVGGSCSLILSELVQRPTDDLDVVNELPEVLRTDYDLLNELVQKHRLRMTHFASHYLPNGWSNRLKPVAQFGPLSVRIVDPVDVLCGKFFSRRIKDYNDIQASWTKISHASLRERLQFNTTDLRKVPRLLDLARGNWYTKTGEVGLPGETLTEAEQRRVTHGDEAGDGRVTA